MGLEQSFYRVKAYKIGCLSKVNQIRRWLVSHKIIEDDDNYVTRRLYKEQLEDLLNDINTVLNDHLKARNILPLCDSGCFFGAYDDEEDAYNKMYFKDLEYTKEIIEDAIENTAWDDGEYITYLDWW